MPPPTKLAACDNSYDNETTKIFEETYSKRAIFPNNSSEAISYSALAQNVSNAVDWANVSSFLFNDPIQLFGSEPWAMLGLQVRFKKCTKSDHQKYIILR
ncbi:unnamed protein product [Strongylus vulgaris]|uniref:Uncharacterized protein n=1 Tax=Strongylus vulgaris TaxID=40348 RepID=A0A3P7JHW3_STRVU|nr:unnamed protein product [Strongylus vulgaris]